MKEIINNWTKDNLNFFKKYKIKVEIESYLDNGKYDVYIFSQENKIAGIELYNNKNGVFISSDDNPEIYFKTSLELFNVLKYIEEYFI